MDSRVVTLRNLIAASLETAKTSGNLVETDWELRNEWFLRFQYEELFEGETGIGLVWLCVRPPEVTNATRTSGTHSGVMERFTVHLMVAFPEVNLQDDIISTHVLLVEQLTEIIRKTVPLNGYSFVRCEPVKDPTGIPFMYVNMERGNFLTIVQFEFAKPCN